MQYLHGTKESMQQGLRAMALLWNFHPYMRKVQVLEPHCQSPFEDLNGFRYHDHAIARAGDEMAAQLGYSSVQVALSWLLHQNTIPIVGVRKATQVKDNLDCVSVKLLDQQLAQLDQVSQIELGFPHNFFNQETPQSFIFRR